MWSTVLLVEELVRIGTATTARLGLSGGRQLLVQTTLASCWGLWVWWGHSRSWRGGIDQGHLVTGQAPALLRWTEAAGIVWRAAAPRTVSAQVWTLLKFTVSGFHNCKTNVAFSMIKPHWLSRMTIYHLSLILSEFCNYIVAISISKSVEQIE